MKKIFKYIIPCMAIALVFASCKDEDDSKRYIDNLYERGTTTEITLTAAAAADYQSITLTATLTDTLDVVEQGFQIATQEDFSDAINVVAERDELTYTATATGLEGSTTYYVRSYVVTAGGGIVFGETQTVTTPRIPIYDINTTFLVCELEWDGDNKEWVHQLDEDGEDYSYYLMSIEFAEGSDTEVVVHGFLGFDADCVGVWDAEAQTVTLPAGQVLGTHSRYGEMFFRGINDAISAYTNSVVMQFTSMGGALVSTNYSLSVSAGDFGFYRFTAEPYEADEEE